MKFYNFLCLLFICLCSACSDSTEKQTKETDQPATSRQHAVLTEYSPKFQKIVKTEDGIIRGIKFGDDLDEVIVKEDTIPLEDSTRYISFTVKLDNAEEEITDVLYYFDENRKIRGFRLDIYLNNPLSVDSISKEFTTYFTDRYGSPVMDDKKVVAWNGLDNTKIVMKDVGIKEAPGLQIQIAKNK